MSRLEELISELCPLGVESKTLGEVATLVRGNGLPKSDFAESGIGCIHYGQIYTYYGASTNITKSFVSSETARKLKKVSKNDIIITNTSENLEDVCKAVAWFGDDEIVTGGHATIIKHNQNAKYLTYYTQTSMFFEQKRKYANGTKVIDVSATNLLKITIPIPALPIQEEIVRILDNFTELTAELTAALAAELAARKQQYEYYRNSLITLGDNAEWKSLGEVCDLSAGGDVPKERYSKEKTDKYIVPIYSNGIGNNALYGYTDNAKICSPSVTISARGTIGYSALHKEPYYPIIRLICAVPKKIVSAEFLQYAVQTIRFQVPATGIAQLTVPMVKKYKIPVPPLAEQERIVAILDHFDTLVNDITKGLPAEIEARKQQYAYYRDKLLTFKECVS